MTFEASADGVTYDPAASATRVAGGWQADRATGCPATRTSSSARGATTRRGTQRVRLDRRIDPAGVHRLSDDRADVVAGRHRGRAVHRDLHRAGRARRRHLRRDGRAAGRPDVVERRHAQGTPTQAGTFPAHGDCDRPLERLHRLAGVTLTINPTAPTLTLDKTSLRFGGGDDRRGVRVADGGADRAADAEPGRAR